MAGARNWGEVQSFPSANESYDDHGYVLEVNGSGNVTKIGSGTGTGSDDNPFGVNYKSSENEDGTGYDTLAAGDPLGVVRESAGYPVVADADDFTIGEPVYVSGSNDGHVTNTSGNDKVGICVETNDLSGGSDGDEHILVAFSFTGA